MKAPVRYYRDLVSWQKGMELAQETYRVTALFPKHELYGLVGQMRRAAISVPANIAEGHARNTTRDFVRFLGVALGSLRELQTHCELSVNLGYATQPQIHLLEEVSGTTGILLTRLQQSLRRKFRTPRGPRDPKTP